MFLVRAAPFLVLLSLSSGCAVIQRLPFGSPFEGPVAEIPPEAASLGHFIQGQAALNDNDVDRAIVEFEKAVREDPNSSLLQLRLAKLYLGRGRLHEALEHCQQVLAVHRNDVEALGLTAGVLAALGQDQEAIAAYERVLALDPDNQEAYLYLGALYGKLGQTDRATSVLRRLIARNPTSILGYYYLGRVHAGAGKLEQAERYWSGQVPFLLAERAIKTCSLDARSEGQPRPLLLMSHRKAEGPRLGKWHVPACQWVGG